MAELYESSEAFRRAYQSDEAYMQRELYGNCMIEARSDGEYRVVPVADWPAVRAQTQQDALSEFLKSICDTRATSNEPLQRKEIGNRHARRRARALARRAAK